VTEPRFPQVLLDAPESEAEEASAALFELGASGVEERDATTLVKGAAGKVTLVASFADEEEARVACGSLPAKWSPRESTIVGDAWRDDWKKYFRPFLVCPKVAIRPPWEAYDAKAGEHVLELEPGRAFGTGLHESTSLVAEALCDFTTHFHGRPILDVGSGSGILALIALTLGADSACCIDVDPEAVEVTRENAARNGFSAQVDASSREVGSLGQRYSLVVANIEASTLTAMAPALIARLLPGGVLMLSGILAPEAGQNQVGQVREAYVDLSLLREKTKGQWALLVLQAGPDAATPKGGS
jgi:ribosomal protein L11 methyltransferase